MAQIVPAQTSALAAGPFAHPTYVIKRPFLSFLGRTFRVFAPDGSLSMFVKHPMFKLRDEFQIYADESERTPLLRIKQREIMAINPTTDVFDANTGEKVGTIRLRGLKSMFKDTWDLLDANDQPIGLMSEDSALLHRLFPIIPGKWHVELGGAEVMKIEQLFRIFTKEFAVDLTPSQGRLDPRFGTACALLALMREIHREGQRLEHRRHRASHVGGGAGRVRTNCSNTTMVTGVSAPTSSSTRRTRSHSRPPRPAPRRGVATLVIPAAAASATIFCSDDESAATLAFSRQLRWIARL
jgi:uncharacterized protein YxjI